jgi:hypothetical protein
MNNHKNPFQISELHKSCKGDLHKPHITPTEFDLVNNFECLIFLNGIIELQWFQDRGYIRVFQSEYVIQERFKFFH